MAAVGLHQVSVVDVARHWQRATIAVGSPPTDVAITADGASAFVPNSNSGTGSVIDVAKQRVVRTGDVSSGGGTPYAAAITRGKVYVVNQANGTLSVLSAQRHLRLIPLPGLGIGPASALSPDGRWL